MICDLAGDFQFSRLVPCYHESFARQDKKIKIYEIIIRSVTFK